MTWPAMAVGLAAIITGAVFDMKTMEVPLYVFPPAIVLSILLVYKGLGPVWYAESLISGMTVLVWMGLVCSVTYLVRRRLEGEDAQAPLGGADLMCSALCCFIFGASGIAVTFFAFILCLPRQEGARVRTCGENRRENLQRRSAGKPAGKVSGKARRENLFQHFLNLLCGISDRFFIRPHDIELFARHGESLP